MITFVGTTGQNLYAGSGAGWYMVLFTNHSKPCSIGQKHSHCLANYSNSIVIGYPGRKLPRKLLTIVYTGKPLPESPLICSCFDDGVDLLRRKIINYGSRRSRLSEGGLLSVRCWLGFQGNQLIFGPGQAQVHRESSHSHRQWNVRILIAILCGAG